ncbi:hypothetical protein PO909_020133 [Leuciscus waleckii]
MVSSAAQVSSGSRVPDSQLEKAQILEMTLTIPVHMLSIKASPGVSVRSRDEMKTQSQRRLKLFQKLQTSCDQNRRESVEPRLSRSDQNTFSKEMKINKSAILVDQHGPHWS